MTTITAPLDLRSTTRAAASRPARWSVFTTLSRRRFALSAHTPREILVPLLTPILFADVIAPALAKSIPATRGIDYQSFVAVGTIGLLVPLSCILGGIGMIVDRESGAQRDLLAAPAPRSLMVFGNLTVALAVSLFQVIALIGASAARGSTFSTDVSGWLWAVAAVVGLATFMHGLAEILAARIKKQEEYVGVAPPVALLPWFLAGSFFPISAMPAVLTAIAKVLPVTHVLALLRYGVVDDNGHGLHDIWGMSNTTAMATLSLAVVGVFAAAVLALSTRVFTREAIS
ncbi:MAG: type transport system permease protein [Acidimicrobiaceae bacterium]|jgi:ABC-type multidrug transport system permease subunit